MQLQSCNRCASDVAVGRRAAAVFLDNSRSFRFAKSKVLRHQRRFPVKFGERMFFAQFAFAIFRSVSSVEFRKVLSLEVMLY